MFFEDNEFDSETIEKNFPNLSEWQNLWKVFRQSNSEPRGKFASVEDFQFLDEDFKVNGYEILFKIGDCHYLFDKRTLLLCKDIFALQIGELLPYQIFLYQLTFSFINVLLLYTFRLRVVNFGEFFLS